MKSIKLLFTIILLAISIYGNAQETIEKFYNLTTEDEIRDFIKLKYDTGYLFIDGAINTLIHINENGDTLETKPINFNMYALTEYDSNFYYLAGSKNNEGAITKLNRNYEIVWDSTYTKSVNKANNRYYYGYYNSVITTSTKSLVLDKTEEHLDYPPYHSVELIDSSASRTYLLPVDMDAEEYFFGSLFELSNTDLLVTTLKLDIFNHSYANSFNEILDASGNYLFRNDFGEDFDIVSGSTMHQDTVYAFTHSYSGLNNLKVLKTVPLSDTVIWEKEYFAGSDEIARIICMSASYSSEDHIVMACEKQFKDFQKRKPESFIFTINSKGDSISSYSVDNTGCLSSLKITTDEESFTLMGTWHYSIDSSDIYFLKAPLDLLYVSSPEINITTVNKFDILPNPASEKIKVKLTNKADQTRKIKVFNVNGTLTTTIVVETGVNLVVKDVSNWKNGLYVFVLEEEGAVIATKKVVVNH